MTATTDDTQAAPLPGKGNAFIRYAYRSYGQELTILCAILIMFVSVGLYSPRFLSFDNLNSIFAGNAYIAVAAIGMSMLIITGQIDVSVGALIGVLATISGTLAVSGYPVWLAWLMPVVIGMAINAVVGILVAYGRIPSIIATLGMLSVLKGGLVSVTGGAWISNLPPDFRSRNVSCWACLFQFWR